MLVKKAGHGTTSVLSGTDHAVVKSAQPKFSRAVTDIPAEGTPKKSKADRQKSSAHDYPYQNTPVQSNNPPAVNSFSFPGSIYT